MEIKDFAVHHYLKRAELVSQAELGGRGGRETYFPCVYWEIGVVERPVEFLCCFGFVCRVVVWGEVFVFERFFCIDS